VREEAPRARIVAFGAHVDTDTIARAVDDGADVALARSQFFRDPAAAISAAGASE
jgi:DNA-binding NarL/FixJ family response regulator